MKSRELTQNNYLNKSKYLLLLVTVSSGETIPYSVNISAPYFDQHSFQINLYSKHFTPILNNHKKQKYLSNSNTRFLINLFQLKQTYFILNNSLITTLHKLKQSKMFSTNFEAKQISKLRCVFFNLYLAKFTINFTSHYEKQYVMK